MASCSNLSFKKAIGDSILANLGNEDPTEKTSSKIAKFSSFYEDNKNNAEFSPINNYVLAKAIETFIPVKRNRDASRNETRINENNNDHLSNKIIKFSQVLVSVEFGDNDLPTGSINNSDYYKKSLKEKHRINSLLSAIEHDSIDLDASNNPDNKQSSSSTFATAYKGWPTDSNETSHILSCNPVPQTTSLSKYNQTQQISFKNPSFHQHSIENILFNTTPKNDKCHQEESEARLCQFKHEQNINSSAQEANRNTNLNIGPGLRKSAC